MHEYQRPPKARDAIDSASSWPVAKYDVDSVEGAHASDRSHARGPEQGDPRARAMAWAVTRAAKTRSGRVDGSRANGPTPARNLGSTTSSFGGVLKWVSPFTRAFSAQMEVPRLLQVVHSCHL